MSADLLLHRTHAQSGYTLFELIVAIGIIAMVFGLAIAGYNTFNKRERLRQSGLTLKSNLRFAQTKALSAEKPASGCTTFAGMNVTFTLSTYSISHLCSEGVVGESLVVTLPTDVTFSPIPASFTFLPLSRLITISAGQSLILANSTESYTLTLSGNGDISDSGL